MKKRILALLLATVMVTSMVACGNDAGNTPSTGGDTTGDTTPDDTNTGDTTPDDGQEPAGGEYDFGGQVVKVYGGIWDKLNPESTDNDVPLAIAAKEAVEAKYNITLQWTEPDGLTGGNLGQIINNSVITGESPVNILASNPDALVTIISAGSAADVTDVIGTLELGSLYTEAGTWKGRNYGYSYDNIGNCYTIAYSRTLLEQIGMEKTPTDMFMEGHWSYSDVLDYCAELKSKLPEGVYPFGIHFWHWPMMAGSANGGYPSVTSDGVINFAEEHYTEAMSFYKELTDKGYACPVPFVTDENGDYDGEENQDFYGDSKITVDINTPTNFVMTRVEDWQQGGVNDNTNGNWGIVLWPWGDDVTVQDTGDKTAYLTLSDNYRTSQNYWTTMMVIADAEQQTGISNEVLLKISWDYVIGLMPERAAIHDAWVTEQAGGDPVIGFEAGLPRNFSNPDDIELYDWAHTRVVYDWAWTFDKAGITDLWTYGARVLMGQDARSVGESAVQEGYSKMENMGMR